MTAGQTLCFACYVSALFFVCRQDMTHHRPGLPKEREPMKRADSCMHVWGCAGHPSYVAGEQLQE